MVKVLESEGSLTNAEVMHFIKNKRAQHAREDAEDRVEAKEKDTRPPRFMKSLAKHERHLKYESYPYAKNSTAYNEAEHINTLKQISKMHIDRIKIPIVEEFKRRARAKSGSEEALKTQLQAELEKKALTDSEWLMLANHAPTTTEMLHPMIEQCDERFTQEELAIIVQCIKETLRKDEFGHAEQKDGDR